MIDKLICIKDLRPICGGRTSYEVYSCDALIPNTNKNDSNLSLKLISSYNFPDRAYDDWFVVFMDAASDACSPRMRIIITQRRQLALIVKERGPVDLVSSW